MISQVTTYNKVNILRKNNGLLMIIGYPFMISGDSCTIKSDATRKDFKSILQIMNGIDYPIRKT